MNESACDFDGYAIPENCSKRYAKPSTHVDHIYNAHLRLALPARYTCATHTSSLIWVLIRVLAFIMSLALSLR